ncbi:hypothetical protein ES707_06984 [subsurface metagenome]
MNIANIHGENVEDVWDSKIGICAGGFITCSLSDLFSIQPELLFTMKGSKAEESGMKVTMKLNYLEIPVLVKLSIPTPGTVKPSLFVGPSLAIKLSGKAKVEYAGESEEADIEDLKSTDFGLVFGGGVDFALGQGKLTVDARYTLGLTTTREPEDPDEKIDMKNGAISIMVGYSF